MARTRNKTPKRFTATMLPNDVHAQLSTLAADLGTSVAALLRWGAMVVLQECGEELPASVVHLGRVSFLGQVPQFARDIEPRAVRVTFDDRTFDALQEKVGGKLYVPRYVHDIVTERLNRDLNSPLN